MKAAELRIGNLVFEDKVSMKIEVIFSDRYNAVKLMTSQGTEIQAHIDLIKPIPLTEEWLLKFGARKINHIYGYTFWTFHNTKQNNCLIDIYENRTEVNSRGVFHCEYVHQLQNLYFALTGEELITNQHDRF